MDNRNYIQTGNLFIIEIKKIKNNGKPVNLERLQKILNLLTLEDGWNLGIRFAEIFKFGDKSWFYCYQDGKNTYSEDYIKSVESGNFMAPLYKYYDFSPIYDIYQHLFVDWSEMGVWQAYLLSKATALLPVIWHGGYGKKIFLFSKNDIFKYKTLCYRKINLDDLDDNLSPKITIEGNTATVSCCFWNNWKGLYRETQKIIYKNGKVEFIGDSQIHVLYAYDCGSRY